MPFAVALIHEEDAVFGASFPDFPGATTTGRSAEEAIRKGSEALSFHVAGMITDGVPVPVPRTLDQLRHDDGFRDDAAGAAIALVPFDRPGRSVRVNISIDEGLLESVDKAAEAAGQSRSSYLAEAARQRIRG